MTRKEEREEAAKNRADQYEHPVDWNNCYHHFIQGAEWADEHPKQGLWDGEKVIKWLRDNQQGFILTNMDIEDLRKVMED